MQNCSREILMVFFCFFFFLFLFLEKMRLNISFELSALIKFYFFLKNKKLNTLTLLELYFIFPLLGKGLSE